MHFTKSLSTGLLTAVLVGFVLFTGCQLKKGESTAPQTTSSLAPKDVQEGARKPLKNLTVGIPSQKGIDEIRTAFSPNEKHVIQALWEKQSAPFDATFTWYAPTGKAVYTKVFAMKKEWTRTLIHYKGSFPMQSGKWSIVVAKDGKAAGKISFDVIRDKSKVPLLAQVKAFKSNKLNKSEAKELLTAISSFLSKKDTTGSLSPALAQKELSLALNIYRNNKEIALVFGEGKNVAESLKHLLANAEPYAGSPADIALSVIHMSIKIPHNEFTVHKKFMQYMGFSVKKGNKSAVLLPSTINFRNMQESVEILRQLCTDASLPENCWKSSNVELTAFKAQEFVQLHNDPTVREFAYNREIIPLDTVTRADILHGIQESEHYYMYNQHPDGQYMYMFYPERGVEPNEDWCLRDLNAVYVYSKIATDNNDQKMLASVKKSIELYRPAIVHKTINGVDYDFLKWDKPRRDTSVSGSAFLLGAMLYAKDSKYDADMKRLADSILKLQEPSGKWRTDFVKPLRDIDQLFFPGETMLVLMEYYKKVKDERIKKAVEKAFPYYLNFWKEKKEGPFVPWQIRAYAQLYDVDPQQKYADFVYSLADWMLNKYHPLGMDTGYGRAGALNRMYASTGVYMEGLATAYRIAKKAGDKKRADRYAKAVHGGSGYALGLQFKPQDTFRYPKPDKIRGGLVMKPFNSEMRLDSTYHSVSALHMTYHLFSDAEWNALTKEIYGHTPRARR